MALILPQMVEIGLDSKNIKYFEEKEYKIPRSIDNWGRLRTPRGTKIMVDVLDLKEKSNVDVLVKCDYCGEEFNRCYAKYINSINISKTKKDACKECCTLKSKETNQLLYGVDFPLQSIFFQEQTSKTLFNRYGVTSPSLISEVALKISKTKQSFSTEKKEQIRQKTATTSLDIYGFVHPSKSFEVQNKREQTSFKNNGYKHPQQNKIIRQKSIDTLEQKYNVQNPMQYKLFQIKFQKTCLDTYGYDNPLKVPEIQQKRVETLYKYGKVRTSSQQIKIYENLLINRYPVILNYPLGRFNLDVALILKNIKINIEYDCYYWHKDKLDKDHERDIFTISQGWKVLRIRSSMKIPDIEQIEDAICKLITTDITFCEIVLDDWGNKKDNKPEEVNSTSSFVL